MLKQCRHDNSEHERALAQGLKEVAAELRLIDVADLIAFIRTGQFGNVRSLVNASTEMYFKPGTMSFSHSGHASLGWSGEPSIALDMEFRHPAVDVFFRLVLEAQQAGVEIEHISFNRETGNPSDKAQQLIEALTQARFMPSSQNRPTLTIDA